MIPIRIRPVRSDDWSQFETLVSSITEFHKETHGLTQARFEELTCGHQEPRVLALVAETEDGSLAGYVCGFPIFSFHKGRAGFQVDNLYVSSSFRRNRIGEALMLAVIERAKEIYRAEVFKLGVLDWNTAAIDLYKQLGFEEATKDPKHIQFKREMML